MSIYHFSASTVSRGKSQSAVASVAYQAAEKIKDEQSGKTKSYTNKREVKYTEILLPDNASEKWRNESNQSKLRADIWNTVEKFEKRKDAVLARKIVVALPEELRGQGESEYDSWKKLVSNYVQETFVKAGMVADWALHDPQKPGKPRNPHVHIMLTVRPLNKNGEFIKAKTKQVYKLDKNGERIPIIDPETGKQKLGARNRKQWKRENVPVTDWEKKTTLKRWRKSWAEAANEYLQEVGAPKIDERSYKEQGKQQLPTKHEGYYAREIEAKNPGSSWKVARNADVRAANEEAAEAAEHERVKIEIEQQIGRQKAILEGTINGIMGEIDARRESRSREEAPRRRIEPTGARKRGLVATSAEFANTSRGQRPSEQPNTGLEAANTGLERRKRAAEPRERTVGSLEQELATHRLSIIESMDFIKRWLKELKRKGIERLRWVQQAFGRSQKERSESLQGNHERVLEAEKGSPEAKPKSAKKLSLAGGIGGTPTTKKPEKPTIEGAVYGQSKPVVHPDRPKRSQDRSIKHDQEQKAWRMAYTLCTIPSMLTLAARKGVAALMTLKKADAKQATATQKRAAIAKITKNLGLKSEFDYLAQQDFDKAYTSMLAEYFVLCATGAFSTSEAVKTHEKGFVQYEKWFEDNQEPEKALEKYFKDAKQQAERVLTVYNRMSEKDFPRPQQTPPRRHRGRSR